MLQSSANRVVTVPTRPVAVCVGPSMCKTVVVDGDEQERWDDALAVDASCRDYFVP